MYKEFSKDFIIKVEDNDKMDDFFTPEIRSFIENGNIHHLESNGEAIMIFNDNLCLAQISDYSELVKFATELQDLI